jgi:hypothetical protein
MVETDTKSTQHYESTGDSNIIGSVRTIRIAAMSGKVVEGVDIFGCRKVESIDRPKGYEVQLCVISELSKQHGGSGEESSDTFLNSSEEPAVDADSNAGEIQPTLTIAESMNKSSNISNMHPKVDNARQDIKLKPPQLVLYDRNDPEFDSDSDPDDDLDL